MSFRSKKRHPQQGYMLLTLMLFVALLAIASMGWIERVDFQIKRDREEELIHRGVQYSRAIRRYVRKFGHYPARIEELESTNNVRYLRKRYKDPITGKDFKLLRQNDVQMAFSPAAASGLPPGSADQGGAPGSPNAPAPGGVGPVSGSPQDGAQQDTSAQTADQPSSSDSSSGTQTSASPNQSLRSFSAQASPNGLSPTGTGNGQFGGLPIVGVASTSKHKSIREFNKKDHYDQWQFVYDPSSDRGGLLSTPNQPAIQGATQMGGQQGAGQGFSLGPGGGMNPLGPAGGGPSGPAGGGGMSNMPGPNPSQPNHQ
ncbi:MAG: hypothetical protein J2P13_04060 [Acidobacteria bacterium]|nr:hypothetical protein [Acidobacteriota bacterium]